MVRYRSYLLSAALHLALIVALARIVMVHVTREERLGSMRIAFVTVTEDRKGPDGESHEPEKGPTAVPSPVVAAVAQPRTTEDTTIPPSGEGYSDRAGSAVLAVQHGGSFSELYGGRSASGRAAAVAGGGGSEATESSVHAALAWLSRHQGPDGSWDSVRFTGQCPRGVAGVCTGQGYDDPLLSPGLTGLALMAFLAGDSTHKSGEYSQTVRKGIRYLLGRQEKDGRITARLSAGADRYQIYNQAICTIALGEACAMARDSSLKPAIESSISFLAKAQQTGGGWDYQFAYTGRNDTSITGWVVMALKSAQAAGVEVPWIVVFNAMRHFDTATLDSGEVVYANTGVSAGRKGLAMVAVGMASRQFLGWPAHSRTLEREADMISHFAPKWERLAEGGLDALMDSSYYWYYGTLAMYQMGGDHWKAWNEAMRDTLVRRQVYEGEMRGSWDPIGLWASDVGGRVYATALNCLDLEIYYRYSRLVEGEALDGLGTLVRAARSGNSTQQIIALRLLREFDQPTAIATLAEALGDEREEMRLAAAQSLAAQPNRLAIPALMKLVKSDNSFVRFQTLQILGRYDHKGLAPFFIGLLDDPRPDVRARAAERLRSWTNTSFGYTAESDPAQRQAAIRQFQDWWQGVRSGMGELATEGKVIAVDSPRRLVVIDVGRKQEIGERSLFAVERGGKFLALLEAQQTYADKTLAELLPDFEKVKIQKGDVAIPGGIVR